MVTKLLSDSQRFKLDREDDRVFYSEPRFVHHLDQGFRSRLTQLYRDRLPPCATVLDLGSSWVSHLPDDVRYDRVIGHGMNEAELQANPRLDEYWLQNFNQDQVIPLIQHLWMCLFAVAAWQYWTEPEAIASELLRVTRPGGSVIVAFSNRMFFTKAPQIWTDSSDSNTWITCHLFLKPRDGSASSGWLRPPRPLDCRAGWAARGTRSLL